MHYQNKVMGSDSFTNPIVSGTGTDTAPDPDPSIIKQK